MDALYVITNSKGSNDRVVLYETRAGEVLFDGSEVDPEELLYILQATNGGYDYIKGVELTDEQMENWEEHY